MKDSYSFRGRHIDQSHNLRAYALSKSQVSFIRTVTVVSSKGNYIVC